jgi:hypothetical protein
MTTSYISITVSCQSFLSHVTEQLPYKEGSAARFEITSEIKGNKINY